jgi:hypothetical protein
VSGKAGAPLAFSFLSVAYAHSHPEIFINQDSRQNETKQINTSTYWKYSHFPSRLLLQCRSILIIIGRRSDRSSGIPTLPNNNQ